MTDLNPLLPPVPSQRWKLILPLTILITLIVGMVGGYFVYLQPEYKQQADKIQTQNDILKSVEGYSVVEKTETTDCFQLLLQKESERKSLCVPEETWDANNEGENFINIPIANN